MAQWKRDTPWRQGHCLSQESAYSLGLVHPESPDQTVVIVISHDCDLAQDASVEPFVEVIVGRVATSLRGDFAAAKNLRRLHLACTRAGAPAVIEVSATGKTSIPKENEVSGALAGHDPDNAFALDVVDRTILQVWLAARYRRAAFPDEFDRRLKDHTKVSEKIAKALRGTSSHILAVFFDVDGNEEIYRDGPDDTYELIITLLYRTDQDPAEAEAAANSARAKILTAFQSKCYDGTTGKWQWIELVDIEVMSDEAMTYSMSQQLRKWQIDHISFRADPPDPILGD